MRGKFKYLAVLGAFLAAGSVYAQNPPAPPPTPPGPGPVAPPGGPGMPGPGLPGPGMRPSPFRFEMPLGYMARFTFNTLISNREELQLTEAQVKRLQDISAKSQTGVNSSMAMNDLQREVREMAAADNPDMVKIEAKVREMEKMRTDETLRDIRLNTEYRAVLTPAQREKMKELSIRPRMPMMPGMGPGAAPGAPGAPPRPPMAPVPPGPPPPPAPMPPAPPAAP